MKNSDLVVRGTIINTSPPYKTYGYMNKPESPSKFEAIEEFYLFTKDYTVRVEDVLKGKNHIRKDGTVLVTHYSDKDESGAKIQLMDTDTLDDSGQYVLFLKEIRYKNGESKNNYQVVGVSEGLYKLDPSGKRLITSPNRAIKNAHKDFESLSKELKSIEAI